MMRFTGNVFNQVKGKVGHSHKRRIREQLSQLEAELDSEDTKTISDTEQREPDNTKKVSDMEEREAFNWADAAIASLEENFLTISSAVVHLYGQLNTEVGSGQFCIVRQSDARISEPVMLVKVGSRLSWEITKDLLVCKLDKLRYLFSIVLPKTAQTTEDDVFLSRIGIPETLNYVVSFPKEEEKSSSLEYLDTFLKRYARFNGPSSLDTKSRFKVKD